MNTVGGLGWPRAVRDEDGLAESRPKPHPLEKWFVIAVILLIDGTPHFAQNYGFNGDQGDGGSPLLQLIWGLTYAASLTGIVIERRRAGLLLKQSLPVVALVGLIALSVVWSGDPSITIKRGFGLFGTTALAYYAVCRFRLAEFLEIFAISLGLATVLSMLAVIALPTGRVYNDLQYLGAWVGIFSEKNALGEAMVFEIVTLLAIPWNRRPTKRMLLIVGTMLTSIVLLVGSRSASSLVLCVLFSAIIIMALLWRWQPRSRRLLSVMFCLLGFALFCALALGFNTNTLLELFNRDSTLTGRTDVWAYVQTAISDRPLLGYGYSTFWMPGGPIDDYQPAGAGWTPFHAHNGFLELALDVGWVGVGVFAMCAIVGIVRAAILFWKDPHQSGIWPLVMMLSFLIVNLDESSIAKYNNLNWVIFVVAFLYAVSSSSAEEPGFSFPLHDL